MKMRFASLGMALLLASAGLPIRSARSDDRQDIVGVWRGQIPGEGSIELTITPNHISGRNPITGESLGEGTYRLDPANKTIDPQRSGRSGQMYFGRYSLEGDTLRWVSNSRGRRRPADLVHRPERDQYMMTLRRQR